MITCQEVMQRLSPFLARKLEASQAQAVRKHLRTCKFCPRVLDFGHGVLVLQERRPKTTGFGSRAA